MYALAHYPPPCPCALQHIIPRQSSPARMHARRAHHEPADSPSTHGGAARRCVSTLTTNAQVGAAIPQSLAEIALVAVEMVMTVTIFNYVLGEITNVIMAQDAALVATRAQACAPLGRAPATRPLIIGERWATGLGCSLALPLPLTLLPPLPPPTLPRRRRRR